MSTDEGDERVKTRSSDAKRGGALRQTPSSSKEADSLERRSPQPSFRAPSPALPKGGGGALRSLGEKFETNAFNGTATMSIPIATPAGRDGLGPELTLSHDSGRGNGPFGMGWSMSIPSIARQTARGVPRYVDARESDVFILSGAEDLVPVLDGPDLVGDPGIDPELTDDPNAKPTPVVPVSSAARAPRSDAEDLEADHSGGALRRIDVRGGIDISFYRPRTEGLYARIERHFDRASGGVHWEVWWKDGRRSVFGRSELSRIANPDRPLEVFEWLLDETLDTKGNVVQYTYVAEDLLGVDVSSPSERARATANGEQPQRYLKYVRYANRAPGDRTKFCFEVVLDYGDHRSFVEGSPTATRIAHRESKRVRIDHEPRTPWHVRRDPFSTGKPGWDLRTRRLCSRVMVFHQFDELRGGKPTLVSSTDFIYRERASATHLASVIQRSYDQAEDGWCRVADLPEVRLKYVSDALRPKVRNAGGSALAAGIDGDTQRFVDLFGEGIAGILRSKDEALYYAPPRGDLTFGPFDAVVTQANAPIRSGGAHLADADGDGLLDVVAYASTDFLPGFFPQTDARAFGAFQAFTSVPNVEWGSPTVQLLDLSGNGRADVVVMRGDEILWYPSIGARGFGKPRVARLRAGDRRPVHLHHDATALYEFADMTGDGLGDFVRIRANDVTFWPGLGHGRFGAPVVLSLPPNLGGGSFDPSRCRLGDIDGTGTTDIMYCEADRIRVLRNYSGNSIFEDKSIVVPQLLDALTRVELADVFGDGTTAILVSSPKGADFAEVIAIHPFQGEKPHLLSELDNGTGRRVRFGYRSSTSYYLSDQRKGRPWLTKLPFPVNVVSRVETFDEIANTRTVTRYAYRDGHYDGVEREFRGFAFVEQWDTESFADFGTAGLFAATVGDEHIEDLHNLPAHTKTWFHVGRDGGTLARPVSELPDHDMPIGMSSEEHREAARALRGHPLRVEITSVGRDGKDAAVPHVVTESAYRVRLIQRAEGIRHSVLDVVERETLRVHCEGEIASPRREHRVHISHDRYGHPVSTVDVAYGHLGNSQPDGRQRNTLATLTKVRLTNDEKDDRHRLGVPIAQNRYELTLKGLPAGRRTYRSSDLASTIGTAPTLDIRTSTPSAAAAATPRRLVGATRALYYDDVGSGSLPLGDVGTHALVYRSSAAVLSVEQADAILPAELDGITLEKLGYERCYLHSDEIWWSKGERMVLGPANTFFVAIGVIDPRQRSYSLTFDPYHLFLREVLDPHENLTTATIDYRVLQPKRIVDPNGAASEVDFDVRGVPTCTRLIGRGEGDADMTSTFSYELFAVRDASISPPPPNWARERRRETHKDQSSRWLEHRTFFDGNGREALVKQRVEPGLALAADGSGQLVHSNTRWLGTGRTLFDNKSNPVKKYEEYFSTHDHYETEDVFRKRGVTPILTYDALGRLVRTEQPDGSVVRVEFHAWLLVEYDTIDTCRENGGLWASREPVRIALVAAGSLSQQELDAEKRAALKAEALAGTPRTTYFDARGRGIAVHERLLQAGATARTLRTRVWLDSSGESEEVRDPRDVLAEHLVRRLDGVPLARHSADAGPRMMFSDALGMPTHVWTGSIGAVTSTTDRILKNYDALSRPTETWARESGTERLAEAFMYGDSKPLQIQNPQVAYLRGRPVRIFDAAGLVVVRAYDFKGNALERERRLVAIVDVRVDWKLLATQLTTGAAPDALAAKVSATLSSDRFTESVEYDALNRPVATRFHDGANDRGTIARTWNERGLCGRIDVTRRDAKTTAVLNTATYDAKGRRTTVRLGNGLVTTYAYDPDTFRLTHLVSKRPDGFVLQSLRYFYDWAGNITETWDRSDFVTKVANHLSADQTFEYDSLYRLVTATGREHQSVGQPGNTNLSPQSRAHPHDAGRMQRYSERYVYDDGGNFVRLDHQSALGGGWVRVYDVDGANNQLRATNPASNTPVAYSYDSHGNMRSMSGHLAMDWDYADRMTKATKPHLTQTACFSYDSAGKRVRKAVFTAGGLQHERIYCGDFECFRQGGVDWECLRIHDGEVLYALVETRVHQGGPTNIVERYQGANHLGSVVYELDSSRRELSYEEYHPYGSSSYSASSGIVSQARYRYTGRERDDETGLQYHGRRYLACWLCRWVSPDPLGSEVSSNAFEYASNRPTTMTDTSGLAPEYKTGNYIDLTIASRGLAVRAIEPNKASPVEDDSLATLTVGAEVEDYEMIDANMRTWKRSDWISTRETELTLATIESVEQSPLLGWAGALVAREATDDPAARLAITQLAVALEGVSQSVATAVIQRAANASISSLEPTLHTIQNRTYEILEEFLPQLVKLDPKARLGIRGSVAFGIRGGNPNDPNGKPDKLGRPFDARTFDLDVYIVSDKLAGQYGRWAPASGPLGKLRDALKQRFEEEFGGRIRDPNTFGIQIVTRAKADRRAREDEQARGIPRR